MSSQMCRDEPGAGPLQQTERHAGKIRHPRNPVCRHPLGRGVGGDAERPVTITTGTDVIAFTAQQKELSGWRTSSVLSWYMDGLKISSWHAENMDGTLKALRALGQPA